MSDDSQDSVGAGTLQVSADIVRAQIIAVFEAWGMPTASATSAATVMVATDLRGVDSHGLNTLKQYDETFRRGALNVKAEWRIVRQSAASALIDADNGLGHPVSVEAMKLAIEKAKAHDVGLVCVYDSFHFGAAGYYAEMAAEAGLIGMVTTSTRGISMLPTFGSEAVLGTNPFAFATPAGRHPPLVLDFATTVAAVNKVRVYARRGKPLPEGWVSDGAGNMVRDADAALDLLQQGAGGGLHPFGGAGMEMGGHKGYGLALFSHILGGSLPGGSFSPIRVREQSRDGPDKIGHYFQAINPEAFRPLEDYEADVADVIDILKAVTPVDPAQPVLVPGEPEQATKAQRGADGIPIDAALRQTVRQIAEAAGAPYLLG